MRTPSELSQKLDAKQDDGRFIEVVLRELGLELGDCKGERALLGTLLYSAVADAEGRRMRNYNSDFSQKRAIQWLLLCNPEREGGEYPPFSFHWVCEHLGLDPRRVRRSLRTQMSKGKLTRQAGQVPTMEVWDRMVGANEPLTYSVASVRKRI